MFTGLANGATISPVGSGILRVRWEGFCPTAFPRLTDELPDPTFTVEVARPQVVKPVGAQPPPMTWTAPALEIPAWAGTAGYRAEVEIALTATEPRYFVSVDESWPSPGGGKLASQVLPQCDAGTLTIVWLPD
jgi:hypothetical protein